MMASPIANGALPRGKSAPILMESEMTEHSDLGLTMTFPRVESNTSLTTLSTLGKREQFRHIDSTASLSTLGSVSGSKTPLLSKTKQSRRQSEVTISEDNLKDNDHGLSLEPTPQTKWDNIKTGILFVLAATFCGMLISTGEHESHEHLFTSSRYHTSEITISNHGDCFLKTTITGPFQTYTYPTHNSNTTDNSTDEKSHSFTIVISSINYNKTHTLGINLENLADGKVNGTKEYIDDLSPCEESQKIKMSFSSTTNQSIPVKMDYNFLNNQHANDVIYAAVILLGVYVLIVFELVHRTLAAMLGSLAALAVLSMLNQRPTLDKVIEWIDEETLSLLFGMMILVAIFTETGFFDYCALWGYKISRGKVWPLITLLCLFAAIVSAFLDNVTTVLLLTPITIRLCEVMHIQPKYVLIAEVLFSNIGGTATAVGDPPNVIIVSNSVLSAKGIDFATFTGHMILGIVFVTVGAYGFLRIQFRNTEAIHNKEPPEILELKREIEIWRKAGYRISPACREENTVKALLQQKVLNLENILTKQIYKKKKN